MDITRYNAVVGSTAQEFADTGLDQSQLFVWQIGKQNTMYELPVNTEPTLDGLGESPVTRMQGFMKTLKKEMDEGAEILALLQLRERLKTPAAIANGEYSQLVEKDTIKAALHNRQIDVDRAEKLEKELVSNLNRALADNNELLDHTFTREDCIEQEFDRQILVMMADWLGDMQVYNRSEAMKYGIPLEAVLMCIMGSNFTKLGPNGEVLKDGNGKFLKGPNFIAPEQHIYATMFGQDELLTSYQERVAEVEALGTLAIPALHNPTADAVDALFEAEDDLEELGPDDENEGDDADIR